MKKGQRLWTREELVLAMNLYCKLPFGKMHRLNPDVINLSKLIDRTAGSVAYKLANFASLDPTLKARGINGASNSSTLDKAIWNEFYQNWDLLPYESETLLSIKEQKTLEELNQVPMQESPIGEMREKMVKVRVNQSFFRKAVLASYNYTCCITGITKPELLIAGHIKPWSLDEKNRLNPRNGYAMNGLHDKAFETGLITITPEYKIAVCTELKKSKNKSVNQYFLKYDNKKIILPSKFLLDPEFLKFHNDECFRK